MYKDDSIAQLQKFEGIEPWMYLDTVGVVTVACGLALFKVADALGLSFGVNGRKATADEVAADWTRVKAMEAGMLPGHYRVATSPVLADGEMLAMLTAKVDELDQALRARLPGYAAAPDEAKVALLDMGYNLGVDGLLAYHHLCAAVDQGDWPVVADECHRRGPSAERNAWTVAQFEQAAKAAGEVDA